MKYFNEKEYVIVFILPGTLNIHMYFGKKAMSVFSILIKHDSVA